MDAGGPLLHGAMCVQGRKAEERRGMTGGTRAAVRERRREKKEKGSGRSRWAESRRPSWAGGEKGLKGGPLSNLEKSSREK